MKLDHRENPSGVIRSILTGAKGEQHPSLWLNWNDARDMMLHDLDSKVMMVEIEPDKPAAEDEEEES
jgi:hypothetical protein